MATEYKGNIKGYFKRFELPSSKCFKLPFKSAGIIFIIQGILGITFSLIGINKITVLIMLLQCMLMVGYYIGVLKKDFWNIVLEESKGLFADVFMWIYYILLCVLSLLPAFIFFYKSDFYF